MHRRPLSFPDSYGLQSGLTARYGAGHADPRHCLLLYSRMGAVPSASKEDLSPVRRSDPHNHHRRRLPVHGLYRAVPRHHVRRVSDLFPAVSPCHAAALEQSSVLLYERHAAVYLLQPLHQFPDRPLGA